MKKFLLLVAVLIFGVSIVYAQSPVSQMDSAVRELSRDIHNRLSAGRAQSVAIGQFVFEGTTTPLGSYWANQITEELTGMSGRSYTLLAGGSAGASHVISGEVTVVADIIRMYTRVTRISDRAVEAAFHSDFGKDAALIEMLFSSDSRSRSVFFPIDEWEPDSMENPTPYEIGANNSVSVMDRTIHSGDDQDFFLIVPASDGWLTMETTGNVDTLMELYDAVSGEKLARDDDSGSGSNARIRYTVQAGHRYIVKVWGYDDSDVGNYGFKAYYSVPVTLPPDDYEPDDNSESAKWIDIGTPQQHTFHDGDDVDWVKFQVNQRGRYTIRARGVNSNRLDTYIELFDESLDKIGEDDDGGEYLDSRLSRTLAAGLYYVKVSCLDSEPDEPYTISIEAE